MTILNYLRNFLTRIDDNPSMEYVNESHVQATPVECDPVQAPENQGTENDFDLTHLTDLEGYARTSSISKESIEQWISSGLLMPDELKVAGKLIKLMAKS
jgi:hypothetical protein